MAMLRMLGRDLHSNYGPTADTGGLMQNHAPTIYGYPSLSALFDGEASGGKKTPLIKPGKSAKLTVTLKAGKSAYLCTVAGHAAAGMKGTLTVK